MRTARSTSRGWSPPDIPRDQTPPEQAPPGAGTPQSMNPPGPDPPWSRHPPEAGTPPPEQASPGTKPPQGAGTPHMDRMTDTCKNITFANFVCGW